MPDSTPKSNFRWLLILQLYFAAFAWGGIQVFTKNTAIYYLFALFMASAASLWTVSDARSRGRPLLHIVQFCVFMSWPVAVPLYLVVSRGFRGVGWSLLHGLCLLVALSLGFYGALYSVYGSDTFAGQ